MTQPNTGQRILSGGGPLLPEMPLPPEPPLDDDRHSIRAQALEEAARMLEAVPALVYPEDIFLPDGTTADAQSARVMRFAYPAAARMVRNLIGDDT